MPISYNTATVELAMTLSTLAYVDENRIASQQEMISEINAGLDEAGYKSWQVAWGPALNAVPQQPGLRCAEQRNGPIGGQHTRQRFLVLAQLA
jgi:hypothetical protein